VQPQPRPTQPGAVQPGTVQPRPAQPGIVQPGQPRLQPGQQAGQPGIAHQGGQSNSADQQIAAIIHGGSHNEVEISKFAESKLQNKEAQAFAEKMIEDHTADAENYQKWAGKQGDAALREGGQAAEGPRPGQRASALDWNQIHEQVAQQCLASAKQELGRHQGAEFDQAYMGMQLAGHMKMQDELKVLKNYASGELQQQIDKSLQVVQGHLQQARQVMEQLKDSPSERVARRPKAQPEDQPEGKK
jgi:predicted outer membrane protein